MSAPRNINVKISHAPGAGTGDWFAKTAHDKKINTTTVYLFQRLDIKPSLARKISDFFNGIRPASDKANKHLHDALSCIPLDKRGKHFPNILSQISHEDKPQLGFNTSYGIVNGSMKTSGLKANIISESEEFLIEKSSWREKLDELFGDSSNSTKNLHEKNNVLKAIYYAIDLQNGTARPKSKSELAAMSEHINLFLIRTPFDEDSEQTEQLQKMYSVLQKTYHLIIADI